MAELILSGDSLNTGRVAINNWYSGGSMAWSATTGNSIKLVNSTTVLSTGSWAIAGGNGNTISAGSYGTILNGSGHTLSGNFSNILGGKGNTATSGPYSVIVNGKLNSVPANYGFVGNGVSNSVTSTNSAIVSGQLNSISKWSSFIGTGVSNQITEGYSAIVSGTNNKTNAPYNFIGAGSGNKIYGTYSYSSIIISGKNNKIYAGTGSKNSVILTGSGNKITGKYSMAFGKNNTITHDYSILVGIGATTTASKQMIFAAGSGPTIKIDYNAGKFYADDSVVGTPADYAEFFEWADGNPNGEKRFGYAVSLVDGGKISIGNEKLLGIISSNPGFIGDGGEFNWSNKYQLDEWGLKKMELYYTVDIQIEENEKLTSKTIWIDSEWNQYSSEPKNDLQKAQHLISEKHTLTEEQISSKKPEKVYLLSENYNPDIPYIPRSERKEYAVVGLLGKLRVRTSEQITSKFIDFDRNGMAINGKTYRVLENIKDFDGKYGIVKIFFK